MISAMKKHEKNINNEKNNEKLKKIMTESETQK